MGNKIGLNVGRLRISSDKKRKTRVNKFDANEKHTFSGSAEVIVRLDWQEKDVGAR